jgi:hypothetical protein
MLMSGDTGLQSHEVEAGHPSLQRNLELRQRLRDWVQQETQILVRPLSSVQASDTSQEEMREKIGRSSADALVLAQHRGATLYADDLGLRKLTPTGSAAVLACSSVTLLSALAQRGLLSAERRDRHLLTLVTQRYAHVHPSVELLRIACRERDTIGQVGLAHVFVLLAGPQMTLAAAVKLITSLVKAELMAPVQFTPPEVIFSLSLAAITTRWPAQLCTRAVARSVAEDLPLFPIAQRAFVRTAQALLKEVAERQIIQPE